MASDVDTRAEQLAANVRQLVEQNQQLLAALSNTAAHIQHVPADAQFHKRQERQREYLRQWEEEILPHKINDPNSPLRQLRELFRWPLKRESLASERGAPTGPLPTSRPNAQSTKNDDLRPEEERKIEDMFSTNQPWNSWQYRMAYPQLSQFLKSANLNKRTRSEVRYTDFDPDDEENHTKTWESTEKYEPTANGNVNGSTDPSVTAPPKVLRQNVLDHFELWRHLRTRVDDRPNRNSSGLGIGSLQRDYRVPCRILRVTDLSAVVAGLMMGSTPRLDLTYVAPFLERYLKFSNWATVNMSISKDDDAKRINTYLFEYHFAFYYVPSISMDPKLASKDFRNIRNVASFDRGTSKRHRYIYEEQLSFILVGHGGDVFTNYQLSEKYYVGPYLKNAEGISVFVSHEGWKPHTMFLVWISTALHHVAARWQTAIDAVNSQIDSPHAVIFHEAQDKSDLLSDDPNFSRSKTYFWAIQVYRLFEETLTITITTWEDFKKDSLDKINDGQIQDREAKVQLIDKAIESLRRKLQRVKKKREEVVSLRDGLFGASSLFDSRTAVRQGDYIRLLTYINLLFLPLTFCTSVFGMQTVLPNRLPMTAFAVTLPAITLSTAFLVFNLEDIVDFSHHAAQNFTRWMRRRMRRHHRANWKKRAEALHEDRAATELPVKKRTRKSTHWMYLIYILEAILVTLPVDELRATLGLWGLHTKLAYQTPPIPQQPSGRVNSGLRAQMVMVGEQNRKEQARLRHRQSKFARFTLSYLRKTTFIFSCFVRFLCLTIWLPLLAIELVILYLFTIAVFVYTGNSEWTAYPDPHNERPFDWTVPLQMLHLHDVHQYPEPTPRQRIREHLRHFSTSEKYPHHTNSNNSQKSPKLLGHTSKRNTTFFQPVTRTVTGIFAKKQKRQPTPTQVSHGYSAMEGGLNIDINPSVLEQGQATPNDVPLNNLCTIVEDRERRNSST